MEKTNLSTGTGGEYYENTTLYGAVDFLIVPYMGMYEWGGGGPCT